MLGAGAHFTAKQAYQKRQFNGLSAAVHGSGTVSTTSSTSSSSSSSSTTRSSSTSSSSSTTTSSSSSTTTSSSTSTSSVITTTTSAVVTQIKQTITPLAATPATKTTSLTRSITVPTSYLATATPTATAAPDNSPPVGTIVGIIAGGLVGVVVLATIVGYFFRKMTRKKDDWDRGAFLRNSVALQDDTFVEKAPMGTKNALALARANEGFPMRPSSTPRPPTMIERRAQGPGFQPGEALGGPQGGYYDDPQAGYYHNFNGAYANDHAYAQNGQYGGAYGAPTVGYTPPSPYQQSQLTRKPSAPIGRGRGGSQRGGESQPPQGYHPGHQSVTPYQQQQYAEINAQLSAPAGTLAPPAADGSHLGRSLSTSYSSLNPQQPAKTNIGAEGPSGAPTDQNTQQTYYPPSQGAPHPSAQQGNNRASYYNDEDAYGGI